MTLNVLTRCYQTTQNSNSHNSSVYFIGIPSIPGQAGIVRRGSMNNIPKPAPPIRRTPSMPAGAPAYLRYSGASTASSEPEYADPQEVMAAAAAGANVGVVASGGGVVCPQVGIDIVLYNCPRIQHIPCT